MVSCFRKASLAFGIGIVSVACAHSITGATDGGRVQTGTWGGEHVAMTVTAGGAHLEFDCASGDINQPLTLDSERRMAMDGVFVREHGGPVRDGETADRRPARYSGRINGNTMTLGITLIDSNENIGTFTLNYGAEPAVRKCL